jgi:hypothetical protein
MPDFLRRMFFLQIQTRINKILPKVTASLKKKVKEFEAVHGEFYYKGCRYLKEIDRVDKDFENNKKAEREAKVS